MQRIERIDISIQQDPYGLERVIIWAYPPHQTKAVVWRSPEALGGDYQREMSRFIRNVMHVAEKASPMGLYRFCVQDWKLTVVGENLDF